MSSLKLAENVVVGDWLNMNSANPDYPAPEDCELNLVRIDAIRWDDEEKMWVFACYWDAAMVPGDPSDIHEYELERLATGDKVLVWSEKVASELMDPMQVQQEEAASRREAEYEQEQEARYWSR